MKARNIAAVSVVALLAGCQMAARNVKPPPLDSEGELWVYLQELPPQAERLKFSLESIAATRADGQEFPLALALADISGKDDRRQRVLASGRLPPGEYTGLSLRVKKATLESGGGGPAREPPRTHRAGAGGPGLLDRASPGPRDDARPPVRPIARQGVRVPALLRGGRPPAAARRADGIRHRHRLRHRDGLRQEDPPGGCGARRRARSPRTLRWTGSRGGSSWRSPVGTRWPPTTSSAGTSWGAPGSSPATAPRNWRSPPTGARSWSRTPAATRWPSWTRWRSSRSGGPGRASSPPRFSWTGRAGAPTPSTRVRATSR